MAFCEDTNWGGLTIAVITLQHMCSTNTIHRPLSQLFLNTAIVLQKKNFTIYTIICPCFSLGCCRQYACRKLSYTSWVAVSLLKRPTAACRCLLLFICQNVTPRTSGRLAVYKLHPSHQTSLVLHSGKDTVTDGYCRQ